MLCDPILVPLKVKMVKMLFKTYSELVQFQTFQERLNYLRIGGVVGRDFRHRHHVYENFYKSYEWKKVRRLVLLRDNGCDLGILDRHIFGIAMVHHINPIVIEDIENGSDLIFDMNNLITTSNETHSTIHYGGDTIFLDLDFNRKEGDTLLWKRTAF